MLLAPIAAAQLDAAVVETRERGAALILDARLPPLEKIELAGPLVADLDPADPRDGLRRALDAQAGRFADDPEEARGVRGAHRARGRDAGRGHRRRVPDPAADLRRARAARRASPSCRATAHGRTVVAGVAAAALILPGGPRRRSRRRSAPSAWRSPTRARRGRCRRPAGSRASSRTRRSRRSTTRRAASAPRARSSRWRSPIPASARAYEREHGVDPRSFGGLLDVLGINSASPRRLWPERKRSGTHAPSAPPGSSRRASQPTATAGGGERPGRDREGRGRRPGRHGRDRRAPRASGPPSPAGSTRSVDRAAGARHALERRAAAVAERAARARRARRSASGCARPRPGRARRPAPPAARARRAGSARISSATSGG